MRVTLQDHKDKKRQYDVLVLFLNQEEVNSSKLKYTSPVFKQAVKEGLFKGKTKETLFLPYQAAHQSKHMLLVGLGSTKEINHQSYRQAAGITYKALSQKAFKTAGLDLATIKESHNVARAITEGFILAQYSFDHHKQKKENEKPNLKDIFLFYSKSKSKLNLEVTEGTILAQAANFARFLGDSPGNLMTPAILAEEVRKKIKGPRLKVTVWNKEKIKKEKMGGLLGVSLGSSQEPRFIMIEYKGARKASEKPICLVGKGLTFDSGGISIKPSHSMDEMKYDMCGGAAVIGSILAVSQMNLKINVIAFVPASENMPGASANKPGDILKARNGKTMEVLNTDAEGRLILADALSYASEKKPAVIIDAATLTGAMVVALGNSHTGFYTRNEALRKRVEGASLKSGEQVWAMPLLDDHVSDIQSPFADVANISSFRGAGSATAAAFLEHFVDKKIPWVHFDIAGTAWNVSNRLSYCATKGASGVMVRTFYEIVRSYIS